MSGFWQCQLDKPVELAPVEKGSALFEPVFKGNNSKTIAVLNKYDIVLSTTKTPRPKDLISYIDIEKIETDKDKARVLIQPMSTTAVSFSWTKTTDKFVAVAIFCNPIKIKNNEIDNKEDIVWMKIFNSGDPGSIPYQSGSKATYLNGEFSLEPKPIHLPVNKLYVWCVWTWDSEGKTISASSRELPIRIIP